MEPFGVTLEPRPLEPRPAAEPLHAALIRSDGGGRYEVPAGFTLTVGRKAHCDVVLEDMAISGFHCTVGLTEEGVITIEDKSTNGTYVNGERVGKGATRTLADG